ADRALCDAALAGMLGEVDAPPLATRFVHPPDLLDALGCVVRRPTRIGRTLDRLRAWRGLSRATGMAPARLALALPEPPFVAVLLQHGDDPRLRLDAGDAAPDDAALVAAARAAAAAIDPELRVAVVPAGMAACHHAATAAAVVTINHPQAIA